MGQAGIQSFVSHPYNSTDSGVHCGPHFTGGDTEACGDLLLLPRSHGQYETGGLESKPAHKSSPGFPAPSCPVGETNSHEIRRKMLREVFAFVLSPGPSG